MFTPAGRRLISAAELRFRCDLPEGFGGTGDVFDIPQVEKMLIDAMPDKVSEIKQMAQSCRDWGPTKEPVEMDCKDRLTILAARTEECRDEVHEPRPPPPPPSWPRRDPYFVTFEMPEKAEYVLFFNGRDVDTDGNMALMGVAVREGASKTGIDISQYRKPETTEIQWQVVPKRRRGQSGPQLVEYQEKNDSEFDPGDAVYAVGLDKKGELVDYDFKTRPDNHLCIHYYPAKRDSNNRIINPTEPDTTKEQNRAEEHRRGHNLDTTPPVTNLDCMKAQLFLPKEYSPTNWWNERFKSDGQLAMTLAKGLLFEPLSSAQLQLTPDRGLAFDVSVVVDKSATELIAPGRLGGNKTVCQKLELNGLTLADVMAETMRLTSAGPEGGMDGRHQDLPISKRLLPEPGEYTVDGQALTTVEHYSRSVVPFAENPAFSTCLSMVKQPRHGENCGERNTDEPRRYLARLPKGFVKSKEGGLKGARIEVGYYDSSKREWHPQTTERLGACKSSPELELAIDVPEANAFEEGRGQLEVRVYAPDSLPIRRYTIQPESVAWDPDLF